MISWNIKILHFSWNSPTKFLLTTRGFRICGHNWIISSDDAFRIWNLRPLNVALIKFRTFDAGRSFSFNHCCFCRNSTELSSSPKTDVICLLVVLGVLEIYSSARSKLDSFLCRKFLNLWAINPLAEVPLLPGQNHCS